MQKVFILAFLLICISAKRHAFDGKACMLSKCANQVKTCDADPTCLKKINECRPPPHSSQEVIDKAWVCLKANPKAVNVIKCSIQNCQAPKKEEETLKQLMKFAKSYA